MQERYLGDSHDFIKYALLRHLQSAANLRIGVNWYLTRREDVDHVSNNDGEKRHHLKNLGWQELDPHLYKRIKRFEAPEMRQLWRIAEWEILPEGTRYFSDFVPVVGLQAWHQRATATLVDTDLIFMDPDTGFEVKSTKNQTMPKYARYAEAADYARAGKVVVCIQFARQCDPVERGRSVREQLVTASGISALLPIVRGRTAPNILFLTLCPPGKSVVIAQALSSFASKCPKVDAIP